MKVFLDTNVLASAAATRGLCADVLREVLGSHELFLSEQVLSELARALRSKFGIGQDLIDDFIRLLRQDSLSAKSPDVPRVALRDKDDLHILGAAAVAGAQVLVTGDKELLALGRFGNLEILSPRQFWERLKTPRRRRTGRGNSHRR
jgi:putative PIN family toxin of toxin-antitoxin system